MYDDIEICNLKRYELITNAALRRAVVALLVFQVHTNVIDAVNHLEIH